MSVSVCLSLWLDIQSSSLSAPTYNTSLISSGKSPLPFLCVHLSPPLPPGLISVLEKMNYSSPVWRLNTPEVWIFLNARHCHEILSLSLPPSLSLEVVLSRAMNDLRLMGSSVFAIGRWDWQSPVGLQGSGGYNYISIYCTVAFNSSHPSVQAFQVEELNLQSVYVQCFIYFFVWQNFSKVNWSIDQDCTVYIWLLFLRHLSFSLYSF